MYLKTKQQALDNVKLAMPIFSLDNKQYNYKKCIHIYYDTIAIPVCSIARGRARMPVPAISPTINTAVDGIDNPPTFPATLGSSMSFCVLMKNEKKYKNGRTYEQDYVINELNYNVFTLFLLSGVVSVIILTESSLYLIVVFSIIVYIILLLSCCP